MNKYMEPAVLSVIKFQFCSGGRRRKKENEEEEDKKTKKQKNLRQLT